MTDTKQLANYPLPFDEVSDSKVYKISAPAPLILGSGEIVEIDNVKYRIVKTLGFNRMWHTSEFIAEKVSQ